MAGDETTLFACPQCEGTLPVSPPVRETLLSEGCVFCGATVWEAAFVAP